MASYCFQGVLGTSGGKATTATQPEQEILGRGHHPAISHQPRDQHEPERIHAAGSETPLTAGTVARVSFSSRE